MEITIKIEAPELAASINNLATALSGNMFNPVGAPAADTTSAKGKKASKPEAPKETPKAEETAAPVETPAATEEQPKADEPTYTLEQVREKLAGLSRDGKQAQVKELIGKFGADKLSSVKPEHYAALLKEAEAL